MAAALSIGSGGHSKALAGGPHHILHATSGRAQLDDPGKPQTSVWGYNAQVPGPLLKVPQGKDVWIRLQNDLTQPTTIHWHGIRIANAMDGVAGLTQDPVPTGETFDYKFIPPDAGTYWYHPHHRGYEQIGRGLYGILIVEEETPPVVDQDLLFVMDDWRLAEDSQIHSASFGAVRDRAHGGRLGNVLTINGKPFHDIPVQAGERLRLRVVNVANARVMRLIFSDHDAKVIAVDGQPVPPFKAGENDLIFAPGQRADLILDMMQEPGKKSPIKVSVGREELVVGHFIYHASSRKRAEPLDSKITLHPNPLPNTVNLQDAHHADLIMTGGAMRFFQSAVYKGKEVSARELVRKHGLVWALNGIAGKPFEPLFRVKRGRAVTVRMVNETRWPHAMHFHGMHFKEIKRKKGQPSPHWRDTVLMNPDDDITVALPADNPGKWLVHCHMLEHHLGGMVTWFEVT